MATDRIRSRDIAVEGLPELSRALKQLGPDAQRELRSANKDMAQLVATDAQGAAASLGGVAAKTAPSIKASAGLMSASVSFGGSSAPYGAGAEFGGQHRPTTMQFKPWLGHTGYFVYPTIRRDLDQIADIAGDAYGRVIAHNFPD